MEYKLRPYQQEASDRAVSFLTNEKRKGHGLIVAGTGTGKSVIIADIASRLDGDVLALEPMLSRNIIKLQITDNHILSKAQSKSKSF